MKTIHTPLWLLSSILIISCVDASSARNDNDAAAPIEVVESAGQVDRVTVYRGQALVARRVPFSGAAGLKELIVTDLPEHAVTTSLHAEASPGVFVRSVRYRARPVRVDVRSNVEELQQELAERRDKLAYLDQQALTINQQSSYLDRLEQFTAAGSMQDLSRGVLDAASLKELSSYLFEQRAALADQKVDVTFQQRDLREQIDLIQRELRSLGARSTRTAREAVVTIDTQQPGDGYIDLFYLVNRATWTPSYTVRGEVDESQLTIEYFASIEQTSGEDWSNVSMTLSTATPSLVARSPVLAALPVKLQAVAAAPPARAGARQELLAQQRGFDRQRAREAQVAADAYQSAPSGGGFGSSASEQSAHGQSVESYDTKLNFLADQVQLIELTAGDRSLHEPDHFVDEGHSVTYTVAGRTTLPSRAGQQLIQIAAAPLTGEFYKVAIPVLTTYVYEEAVIDNRTGYVLLAGPVSTYADGQFVGHSSFDDTAIGESMTVGLGINSLVRSERHVLNQDERIQGGNRVVDITFRLTLQNFSDQPMPVRLKDRLPQVRPEEIRLTVLDDGSKHEQVQDHHYDADAGIMSWDVLVPAGATGADALAVDYTIRLEYDRQMTLAGM